MNFLIIGQNSYRGIGQTPCSFLHVSCWSHFCHWQLRTKFIQLPVVGSKSNNILQLLSYSGGSMKKRSNTINYDHLQWNLDKLIFSTVTVELISWLGTRTCSQPAVRPHLALQSKKITQCRNILNIHKTSLCVTIETKTVKCINFITV